MGRRRRPPVLLLAALAVRSSCAHRLPAPPLAPSARITPTIRGRTTATSPLQPPMPIGSFSSGARCPAGFQRTRRIPPSLAFSGGGGPPFALTLRAEPQQYGNCESGALAKRRRERAASRPACSVFDSPQCHSAWALRGADVQSTCCCLQLGVQFRSLSGYPPKLFWHAASGCSKNTALRNAQPSGSLARATSRPTVRRLQSDVRVFRDSAGALLFLRALGVLLRLLPVPAHKHPRRNRRGAAATGSCWRSQQATQAPGFVLERGVADSRHEIPMGEQARGACARSNDGRHVGGVLRRHRGDRAPLQQQQEMEVIN